jgi:hypothetical protein
MPLLVADMPAAVAVVAVENKALSPLVNACN